MGVTASHPGPTNFNLFLHLQMLSTWFQNDLAMTFFPWTHTNRFTWGSPANSYVAFLIDSRLLFMVISTPLSLLLQNLLLQSPRHKFLGRGSMAPSSSAGSCTHGQKCTSAASEVVLHAYSPWHPWAESSHCPSPLVHSSLCPLGSLSHTCCAQHCLAAIDTAILK